MMTQSCGHALAVDEPNPTRVTQSVSDCVLIDRFVEDRTSSAFAELVRRYGPMVYGVCQRRLPCSADVDDAFQATFCVLMRRAAEIQQKEKVGHWLYRVAWNVSGKYRKCLQRNLGNSEAVNEVGGESSAETDLCIREQARLVQREVDGLPSIYRDAVVLCYMQGLTHEDAGRVLGCPAGTVGRRLSEAKDRLKKRFALRGLGATAIALLAPQAVPATLMAATTGQASAAVPPLIALTAFTKLALALVTTIAIALGVAFFPDVVSSGFSRSPALTSDEEELVSKNLSVRPQLDGLDKREVPAVLSAGNGVSWTYDAGSKTLDVQGSQKDDVIHIGKDASGQVMIATGYRMNLVETAPGKSERQFADFAKTGVQANSQLTIRVNGAAGNDQIMPTGNWGMQQLRANEYKLAVFSGGEGNDYLQGGMGLNHLFGGNGHDTLITFGPGTRMFGEAGNDALTFRTDSAEVKGGAGNDVFELNTHTRAVPLSEFLKMNQDYETGDKYQSKVSTKSSSFK